MKTTIIITFLDRKQLTPGILQDLSKISQVISGRVKSPDLSDSKAQTLPPVPARVPEFLVIKGPVLPQLEVFRN